MFTQLRPVARRAAVAVALFQFIGDKPDAMAQPDDVRERTAETLDCGRVEAAAYVIRTGKGDQEPIELHPESILQWNNSVNQSVFGNIFIWTRNGRPEVVASIYRFYSPKVDFAAEFQSLSLEPLIVRRDGDEVWTPREPGIELQPFADAGQPSNSRSRRLIQMRQLAGALSVKLTDWSEETYDLRLLPRPLIRYDSADAEVLDGALFAFTYTTDPELLVMIEARKSDNGYRWLYGLARMNTGSMTVSLRDQEVWTAERLEDPFLDKQGIYTLFQGLPLPVTDEALE